MKVTSDCIAVRCIVVEFSSSAGDVCALDDGSKKSRPSQRSTARRLEIFYADSSSTIFWSIHYFVPVLSLLLYCARHCRYTCECLRRPFIHETKLNVLHTTKLFERIFCLALYSWVAEPRTKVYYYDHWFIQNSSFLLFRLSKPKPNCGTPYKKYLDTCPRLRSPGSTLFFPFIIHPMNEWKGWLGSVDEKSRPEHWHGKAIEIAMRYYYYHFSVIIKRRIMIWKSLEERVDSSISIQPDLAIVIAERWTMMMIMKRQDGIIKDRKSVV